MYNRKRYVKVWKGIFRDLKLYRKSISFLEVRFISVNDNLDTKDGIKSDKSYEIAIKNIFNDLYAKDISKESKSLKSKNETGSFIGATSIWL